MVVLPMLPYSTSRFLTPLHPLLASPLRNPSSLSPLYVGDKLGPWQDEASGTQADRHGITGGLGHSGPGRALAHLNYTHHRQKSGKLSLPALTPPSPPNFGALRVVEHRSKKGRSVSPSGGGGGIRTRVRKHHRLGFYKLIPCFWGRTSRSHGQDRSVPSLLRCRLAAGRHDSQASPLGPHPRGPAGSGPGDGLR